MYKNATIRAVSILILLGAVPALSGCHTTAGLGQDVSKTGQAVTKSANEVAP
jgi:predicted small secreted protein